MKKQLNLFNLLIFSLLTVHAAVPLAWEVRPGQPAPATFDRYHGETLAFTVTFKGFGELPFAAGADVRLWYQTNGMGTAWWSAPAVAASNVITATWSPELDPGAERVSLFFGAPSNAYAAAVLRLRHSPGFTPANPPPPAAFSEADPVFSAWLEGYVPPITSLEPATNYTDRATNEVWRASTNYADALETRLVDGDVTVKSANVASSYGTPTRWTDATGCVWEVTSVPSGQWTATTNVITDVSMSPEDDLITYVPLTFRYLGRECWSNVQPSEVADLTEFTVPTQAWYWYYWDDDLDEAVYDSFPITFVRGTTATTNLIGRVAMTNDLPDVSGYATMDDATNAAEAVAGPMRSDIEGLRTESALVYRLYQGSNVVVEVTNYNSTASAPELRLMQLNESNDYVTVWTETNGLARTLRRANEYTDAAITNRAAPKAWSKVTAGLGFEAPSNTTWLSTARTVIAGGLEYEKHLTSGGAIWLLESNGMTADFHPQTNNTAFIDLSNADGTPIFRVEKTDSFLVGVHIDDVTVDGSALVCGVAIVAQDHPLVRVCTDIVSGDWVKEEDGIPASLATVTWSGTAGDWTCRVQNNTGGNTLFAQMEYFQEGGTKIVNSAVMDVSEGILCTDGIHKCRPVYSSAGGGTITWEVVQ